MGPVDPKDLTYLTFPLFEALFRKMTFPGFREGRLTKQGNCYMFFLFVRKVLKKREC